MTSTFGNRCRREQQLVLHRPPAVVGVEDSLLAFDDVQRRTTESAAFQS